MWKVILGILTGLGILTAVKKTSEGASAPKESPRPTLAIWRPIVKSLLPAELDLDFVMKWIEVESGGNPCAVGSFKQRGPDGHPREMGIGQFYNPDDLIRIKLTGDQLRAYCIPETQKLSRPLTGEEMRAQAQATIDLILYCRQRAIRDLQGIGVATGKTVVWSPRDFYALIKLQHGLPVVPKKGLPAVTKLLGRPPSDFAEFATNMDRIKLDASAEKYRPLFARVLSNAVKTAAVVTTKGNV
jgi:hypothetical protein